MIIELALLTAGTVYVIVAVRNSGKWRRTLADVAGRRDLQLTRGDAVKKATAHGAIDDIPITIDTYFDSIGESRVTCSRISSAPRMPDGLMLQREGLLKGKRFKGEDLVIGDANFDGDVVVRGPARAVRALLDAPTRTAVLSAISCNITIEEGAITWFNYGLADAEMLDAALDQVLDLAQRLSRPADAAALANVVRTDAPAVALEALRIMPAGPQRDVLDVDVVASRVDELVMIAAGRIGPAAAPGVVRVLQHRNNSDVLRAEAMTWLGAHVDATEFAVACLAQTQPSAGNLTAAAALAVLTKTTHIVSLETLARLIKQDDVIAPEALRAAARHGPRAEPLLIAALADKQSCIARAAADSLGLVGTPAAVMPLRARIKGLLGERELKAAANAAIKQIQGRVGEKSGGLSVAVSSAAGRLSETE